MIIEATSLFKTYTLGGRPIKALDDVSLSVNEGDLLGIIGASGSGKSTLMNILGCLDRPDAGSYKLTGQDVSKLNKDRLAEIRNAHIGFVFQSFNLLPRMTAVENVELPLMYAGNRNPKKIAEKMLEMVGLGERMNHEPNKLSGGERQRVAVARALSNNPALLLADEPTGNLDSATTEEILSLFMQLNAEGRTIVIVTHDPEVAEMCRRVVRMKDGKIAEERH